MTLSLIRKYISDFISTNSPKKKDILNDLDVTLNNPLKTPPYFGDHSTNALMLLSFTSGGNPFDYFEEFKRHMISSDQDLFDEITYCPPGFVNFSISREYLDRQYLNYNERVRPYNGTKTIVEFVSANPTGPLTAASARHAIYGNALANLFSELGYETTKEFYINNYGVQFEQLVKTVKQKLIFLKTANKASESSKNLPYDNKMSQKVAEFCLFRGITDTKDIKKAAVEVFIFESRRTLSKLGVTFDNYFCESSLFEGSLVQKTINWLSSNGHTYTKEGALHLRTSEFGDDKDRVLIKKDGLTTYFASDIAYHKVKIDNGNTNIVNVLGADHHGYVARMQAAIRMLDPDNKVNFKCVILQLVNLDIDGSTSKMSKRNNSYMEMDELIESVSPNSVISSFLSKSHNTPITINEKHIKKTSLKNIQDRIFNPTNKHTNKNIILRCQKGLALHLLNYWELIEQIKSECHVNKLLNLIKDINQLLEIVVNDKDDPTSNDLISASIPYNDRLLQMMGIKYE